MIMARRFWNCSLFSDAASAAEALAAAPAYTFFCYIDAIYVAADKIQGITPDTVLGHHGVGIFWNICDWTI